jgi:gamma-glutamyltranspeptidase/glutathione hydrolase
MKGANMLIRFVITIILVACLAAIPQNRPIGKSFITRSEVIAENGMAVTSQPLATQAALDILRKGGNAIDAAIAANAVLGLTEPTGCGIGGDLFAIIWDSKTGKLYGLNASGRSPHSLSMDYFKQSGIKKIPTYGPLPVTVPGCVDGWFEMHEKFGKLSMTEILAPAIRYARYGFPVSEIIAHDWEEEVELLREYPNFKEIFTIDGIAPKKGQIFKNIFLAETLEKIAAGGGDVFYRGYIAKTIDRFMKRMGGFLSYQDLADHRSEWVEPVSSSYRGYDVWELPPNGQGIAALQMLNILEGFDLKSMGFATPEYLHLIVETKKLVYEDRARYYADPQFNMLPVKQLISKEYALDRRKLIDTERAANQIEAGKFPLEEGDTVYLTTADAEGNMVSLIQSNYQGMGSGMVPDGLGFVLQDRGELFSLQEDHFNIYAPQKRPFHTIIPAFVTKDGKPWMSFGVMGGSMQPQGHVQILVNLIDFGMGLQEAGDAPRIRHTGSSQPTGGKMSDGGWINVESGISSGTIEELKKMGHQVRYRKMSYGGYQAIMVDTTNGVYYGASDFRKDGQAAGY